MTLGREYWAHEAAGARLYRYSLGFRSHSLRRFCLNEPNSSLIPSVSSSVSKNSNIDRS
jgi:hypothetical protein